MTSRTPLPIPRLTGPLLLAAALAAAATLAAASPALVGAGWARTGTWSGYDPCQNSLVRTLEHPLALTLVEAEPSRWVADVQTAGVPPLCVSETCHLYGSPEAGWRLDSCTSFHLVEWNVSPLVDGSASVTMRWLSLLGDVWWLEGRASFAAA